MSVNEMLRWWRYCEDDLRRDAAGRGTGSLSPEDRQRLLALAKLGAAAIACAESELILRDKTRTVKEHIAAERALRSDVAAYAAARAEAEQGTREGKE